MHRNQTSAEPEGVLSLHVAQVDQANTVNVQRYGVGHRAELVALCRVIEAFARRAKGLGGSFALDLFIPSASHCAMIIARAYESKSKIEGFLRLLKISN